MKVTIGKTYEGIGYIGTTDGEKVIGRLIEFYSPHDHAILVCEKTNIPCAVKFRTLKEVKNGTI